MTQYRNVALGELSPHVYAIAEQVSLTCTCTGTYTICSLL